MGERIRHLVIKEFIQLLRDRRMRAFLFIVPVIQVFVLGYAATFDVNSVSTVVIDFDRSSESREIIRRFTSSGYFSVKANLTEDREVIPLLDKGKTLCVIEIEKGFSERLRKGIPSEIQVLMDGTDSNTAMIATGYVHSVLKKYGSPKGGTDKSPFRTRIWYNPDLRSKNYMVPGVISLIVMLTSLIVTSMSIVREREVGTIEQLMVTPIKPVELIVGKTIPPALICFFDMILVTIVGLFWFNIPIRGSFLLLALCTAIYLLSTLGIGLFISTLAKTQQQAIMATFLFFQPAILLSGFATPIENMPQVFQYLTYLNPLRYFLVIVRGIFLKGNGFDILWTEMAMLFLLGFLIFTLSSVRFRKRLN
ncbi:MAG: ABC transporter permease [Syntrophorhabdaceae bacterium]|nr:ABC transporter permease [Syntrophorhabdaceae bacterium]